MFLFLHPHSSPPHSSTYVICTVVTSDPPTITSGGCCRALWYDVTGKKSQRAKKKKKKSSIIPACPCSFQPFFAFRILLRASCRVHVQGFDMSRSDRTKAEQMILKKTAQWCIIHQCSLVHLCTREQEAVPSLTLPAVLFLLLATSVHPFCGSVHH